MGPLLSLLSPAQWAKTHGFYKGESGKNAPWGLERTEAEETNAREESKHEPPPPQ